MVRIDPGREHSIPSPSRASDAAAPRDQGFASTLAAAREPALVDPRPGSAYEAIVARHRADPHATPLAERWGQDGRGATAAGYGEAPDPATLADVPVGRNAPAHPLNPEGTSGSTPPYDIPGFTARGTPIPPGFYNLAYYQRYLREGGTPIEGFPGYDPADGSLRDVYGSFGDGRARATSFVTATANAPAGPLHIAYEEKALAVTPATSAAPSVETPPAAPAAAPVTAPGRSRRRRHARHASRRHRMPAARAARARRPPWRLPRRRMRWRRATRCAPRPAPCSRSSSRAPARGRSTRHSLICWPT